MLPRNDPDRIQITFDDRHLVANAGLLLVWCAVPVLMLSTIPHSTSRSASSCSVQGAGPYGGWEQAKAINWSSSWPSSFLGRRVSCSLRPRDLSRRSSTQRRRTRPTVTLTMDSGAWQKYGGNPGTGSDTLVW